MKLDARSGWYRLAAATAIVLIAGLAFVVLRDPAQAFLQWFDRLAPKPGLSGLLLLGLSPVLFLAVAAAVNWVLNGPRSRR